MSFVEHVNRGRVIRVEAIMMPLDPDDAQAGFPEVPVGTLLEDTARLLISGMPTGCLSLTRMEEERAP